MALPIRMQYRAIEFVKSHIVRYISGVFRANAKGALLFTDGTNEIKFSRAPYAVKEASWVARETPAILICGATGSFVERSIAKNKLYGEEADPAGQYRYEGGDIDLDIELSVRANTKEERDNIVDILGIFLANRAAKTYFEKQDIKLPEPPRIGGESEIMEPNVEYPIYATAVSVAIHSSWLEWEPLEARIIDVIAEYTMELTV
jgi:hypothetical protein